MSYFPSLSQSKISQYPEIAAALTAAQETVTNSDERQVEDDLAPVEEEAGLGSAEDVVNEEEAMNEEEMMNEEEAMNEEAMNDETYYGAQDDDEGKEFEEEDEVDGTADHEDEDDDDDEDVVDEEKYFLEPEQAKHRGQEPTLPLIAAFSQVRAPSHPFQAVPYCLTNGESFDSGVYTRPSRTSIPGYLKPWTSFPPNSPAPQKTKHQTRPRQQPHQHL